MDRSFLATRVQIPPLPRHHLSRPRLVDALERNLRYHKLGLVLAPGGYGKTTLLAEWARSSASRVGWLVIGEEHNAVEWLLRYLVAAWERFAPDIRSTSLGLLLEPMFPDIDQVLRAFVNLASDQDEQTVFVLDNIDMLSQPQVFDVLSFLLENVPPHFHFVLGGRAAPPLPLSRYRAGNDLWELDADTIAFDEQESRRFFEEATGLDLTQEELGALQSGLEGWIAGLQLLSLTSGRRKGGQRLEPISSRHRFITDFLRDDVLSGLSGETRQFLIQTSILSSLSGKLCNAVTRRVDGQVMLERLERNNLFTAPLDDRREWFRYHSMFAEFLRDELQRESIGVVNELHRRAAKWYLDNEMPELAYEHAVAGDDVETGTRVLDGYAISKLESGEHRIVEQWLKATPPEWFGANPSLSLYRGARWAFQGNLEAFARELDDAEEQLERVEREDKPQQLAKLAVARCAMACFQNDVPRAELYAQQALSGLRPEDITLRANIHHALADSYRRNHRWSEARTHYHQIMNLPHDPTWTIRSAHVYGALADLELMQGRLRVARELWTKARAAIEQPQVWGLLPVPIIGWVYIRMAELHFEWDERAKAGDLLARGLERAELGGDVRAMISGYLTAGRLALAEGDSPLAVEYLERAQPLVEQSSFPECTGPFERLRLETWLAQDRLRAAVEWSDQMLLDEELRARPENDTIQLAVARVLLFKGDSPSRETAIRLLEPLIVTAAAEDRHGVQIEALAMWALAQQAAGDTASAMTFLERALRLAEPEGYVRLFVDLGLPMLRLLQESHGRQVMPRYVERLFESFSENADPQRGEPRVMPEPLSDRELEILGLVAAGLTNREIADKLFISAETVKKHAGNIFAKLGVSNRTEASARARSLHLLDERHS
jgi:LuxR family maltose regulon positive regulatory protein